MGRTRPPIWATDATNVDFVIVTALAQEREAVTAKLGNVYKVPPTPKDIRHYFVAELHIKSAAHTRGKYKLALLSLLGMGRVEAAAATGDAIRRWRPRYVLLVGIAGGISDADIKLGDVIISDQIVDYELQKLTLDGPQIRYNVYRADPLLHGAADADSSTEWANTIVTPRPNGNSPGKRIGPIATGDKVVAFGDFLREHRAHWPKLIGVEMEAGGAAAACFQSALRPGFFMIRGVSDFADEKKNDVAVTSWREYACEAAAAYTVHLLKQCPVPVYDVEETTSSKRDQDDGHELWEMASALTTYAISGKHMALREVAPSDNPSGRQVRRLANAIRQFWGPGKYNGGIFGICVAQDDVEPSVWILRIFVRDLRVANILKNLREVSAPSGRIFRISLDIVGEFKSLSRPFLRPIPPGASIGNVAGSSGTLGCFAKRHGDDNLYILSCAHVLLDSTDILSRSVIIQPALSPRGPEHIVAKVVASTPLVNGGTVDAALAMPIDFSEFNINNRAYLQQITGVRNPQLGEQLIVRGAGSDSVLTGRCVSVRFTAIIKLLGRWITLRNLAMAEIACRYGDSGAVVMSEKDSMAVGLVVGTDNNNRMLFCTMPEVIRALDISELL